MLRIGASAARAAEDALLMPVGPAQRAGLLDTLRRIVLAQE